MIILELDGQRQNVICFQSCDRSYFLFLLWFETSLVGKILLSSLYNSFDQDQDTDTHLYRVERDYDEL